MPVGQGNGNVEIVYIILLDYVYSIISRYGNKKDVGLKQLMGLIKKLNLDKMLLRLYNT